MSVIHTPREPQLDARQAGFLALLFLAFAVFVIRLWYLQVVRAEELSRRAVALRTASTERIAPRGLIYDRNGVLLAGIKPALVLTAVPATVTKKPWIIKKLAGMLGVTEESLWAKVEETKFRPFLPAAIYVGAPIKIASQIAEMGEELPGIGVESHPLRFYNFPETTAHVLGYVWIPSDVDVKRIEDQGLEPADYVGKAGLEQAHEKELMGKPGIETVEIDSKNRPIRLVRRDNPSPGSRLYLALDYRLQALASDLLKATGHPGAVVAIEPSTGEILCLVSSPTYDPTQFVGGISHQNWAKLRDDPRSPIINRAIVSAYAPGSTFKIVNSLAAYRRGFFSPNAVETCTGGVTLGNRTFKCLGVHGTIPYTRALAVSCNSFFMGWARQEGADALCNAALELGLGERTGIDLPNEKPGVIPTDEWLRDKKRTWYPGDTLNLGIGQGMISVTPLQLANVMAIVANNGVAYRPHMVHAISTAGEAEQAPVEPVEAPRVDADLSFWQAMKAAMVQVIESGTATVARIPGIRWAGKTGSAEHVRGKLTHSWFAGFAPFDNPKIAIAVIVEEAGHGSTVAAPIAREIVKTYLAKDLNSASVALNAPASRSAAAALGASPISR